MRTSQPRADGSPRSAPTSPPARTVLVALPGLILAGFGLSHPHLLDALTAQWWTTMHTLLLLVFPLLGAAQWVLLESAPVVLRWVGRIAAFGYVAFYGALDAMAGVGAGAIAIEEGGRTSASQPLFDAGNGLGDLGGWAFLAGNLVIAAALAIRVGWRAAPAAVVLLVASYFFREEHIYWPGGVLSMIGLAIGFAVVSSMLPGPAR